MPWFFKRGARVFSELKRVEMEKIGATDVIFDFNNNDTRLCSYFGWEFNNSHAFYNYAVGYKKAADATYEAFKKAVINSDIETTDTICYPLVFLYRHIVELLLKFSYIRIKSIRIPEEIRSFLNKNHDLQKLWDSVKIDFERLSKRLGDDIDSDAVEHYINEFIKYDKKSMAYRYPIEKNLNRFHDKGLYLNTPVLKESMDKFFYYMVHIIDRLSDSYEDDECNPEFEEVFFKILNESLHIVKETVLKIEHNLEESNKTIPNKKWLDFSDIDIDNLYSDKADTYGWVNSFSEKEKSLLIILYIAGTYLQNAHLAEEKNERRKDVLKLIYSSVQSDFSLDSPKSQIKDNYFTDKIAYGGKYTVEAIKRTLHELEVDL